MQSLVRYHSKEYLASVAGMRFERTSTILQRRFHKSRKCLSSKAALTVLVLVFLEHLIYLSMISLKSYNCFFDMTFQYFRVVKLCIPAIIVLFYPVAGLLADLKFGRYRMITASLWMLVMGTPFALLGSALYLAAFPFTASRMAIFLVVIGSFLLCVAVILLVGGVVGFNSNVIQFGLDQLYDSPSEDQIIFILWYMWTYHVATLILHLKSEFFAATNSQPDRCYYVLAPMYAVVILLIMLSIFIMNRKKDCFFINFKAINPYKLVYQVTKFARHHKVPISRSAFTYCEEEIPSGLNLGKKKYGGPFTVEEVEDVKVFYGILRILFSLGPVFFLDIAAGQTLVAFNVHIHQTAASMNLSAIVKTMFLDGKILYDIEIVFFLPVFIVIVRPLISYYVPATKARMGIGMFFYLVTLLMHLVKDVLVHSQQSQMPCMFNTSTLSYLKSPPEESYNASWIFSGIYYFEIAQHSVYTLSNIVIMVSMYEFIASQSPRPMQGLIVGLSFVVIGFFKALGALLILLFVQYWHMIRPSCGIVYFCVNIALAIVALVVYVWQARHYQNRLRDEPCQVRRFVEEYYSKLP